MFLFINLIMRFVLKAINITSIIVLSLVALMHTTQTFEKYSETKKLNELIPKKELVVFQGVSANNTPLQSLNFEDDEMKPSVDGSKDSPKSLFMFAYNKVSPECCQGKFNSGYSTNGGCVCVTDKQKQYFSKTSKTLQNLDKCIFP
jgi:hypothetical protein